MVIDQLLNMKGGEVKALLFMLRITVGFHRDPALPFALAISEFVHGARHPTSGKLIVPGVFKHESSARNALAGLKGRGWVKQLDTNGPRGSARWCLVWEKIGGTKFGGVQNLGGTNNGGKDPQKLEEEPAEDPQKLGVDQGPLFKKVLKREKAVDIYKMVFGFDPPEPLSAVDEHPHRLRLIVFEETARWWRENYNPRNIEGLIDRFQKRIKRLPTRPASTYVPVDGSEETQAQILFKLYLAQMDGPSRKNLEDRARARLDDADRLTPELERRCTLAYMREIVTLSDVALQPDGASQSTTTGTVA